MSAHSLPPTVQRSHSEMPTKLTADLLVEMLKESGLIDASQLDADLRRWQQQEIKTENPRTILLQLVKEEKLTRWQAEKLIQGKHRGFFLGKYRLLELLGTGGMSSVYLAEHTLMRRQVAIKVLPQNRIDDASYLERFHREAQAVAALDHPNIVRAYDVNQEGTVHFLVMEYVAGASLQDLVDKNGPLGFVQAVEYLRQTATGLQHAHQAGLVHRDIKPANLLVDERGVVKMLDLGLARFFHSEEESPLTLKYDEKVLGTADYLSPEQALNSHEVDTRADVYSLGCTMYFLLTGHPPFPEGTLAQRLMYHQMKEPAPLEQERADTPPDLVALVKTMMQKQPAKRYQSVRDINLLCTRWLKQHGGDTWVKMKSAARAPSVPQTSSNSKSRRKKSKSSTINKALDKKTRPATNPAPPRSETSKADPDMASFLEAMSQPRSEPEPSTVAADTPPRGVKTKPASSEPPVSPDVEPRQDSASKLTLQVDEDPDEAAQLAPDDFNFARDTAASVSQTADLSKSDHLVLGSGVAPGSSKSQVVSKISQLGITSYSLMRKRPILAVAISLTTLLLGVAMIFTTFGNGETSAPGPSPGPEPPTPGAVQRGFTLIEKTIGPAGDFQTIAAALEFAQKQVAGPHPDARIVFAVEAGQTFAERIVIDNTKDDQRKIPRGVHFVVKEGIATLAPGGPDPVVSIVGGEDDLTEVRFFHLEGFEINAGGSDVAVSLSGVLPRCKLQRLSITGFKKIGIQGDAARGVGNDQITLADVNIRPAAPDATGVQFVRGQQQDEDPANIQLSGCRFWGPMKFGVDFAAPVRMIGINQSIFCRTDVGIGFSDSSGNSSSVRIANDSFYENSIGISFEHLTQIRYGGCAIRSNAFVGCATADVLVRNGYSDEGFWRKFSSAGSHLGENRTDSKLKAGDANIYGKNPFQTKFQFQSTDPTDPNFLIPHESSDHREIGVTAAQP